MLHLLMLVALLLLVGIILAYSFYHLYSHWTSSGSSSSLSLPVIGSSSRNEGISLSKTPERTHLSSEQCSQISTAEWRDNACFCRFPYYGNFCSLEHHDEKYFGIGAPPLLSFVKEKEVLTSAKSFSSSESSCSSLCDESASCRGFIYSENKCTLISSQVIVPTSSSLQKSVNYLPHKNTLFLRDPQDLIFPSSVFFGNPLPSRYWQEKDSSTFLAGQVNRKYLLTFWPREVKVPADATGIYSRHPFSPRVIRKLAEMESEQIFVHQPGTELSLPPFWKHHLPLHVTYFS